jgi:hypothetical protein
MQGRGQVQILNIHLAEYAEGRAVGCHLQSTGQLWVFCFQRGTQLDEPHGEIVTMRIYFELAVEFDWCQPRLHSVRDHLDGLQYLEGLACHQFCRDRVQTRHPDRLL